MVTSTMTLKTTPQGFLERFGACAYYAADADVQGGAVRGRETFAKKRVTRGAKLYVLTPGTRPKGWQKKHPVNPNRGETTIGT